jgi:hypothetical protein
MPTVMHALTRELKGVSQLIPTGAENIAVLITYGFINPVIITGNFFKNENDERLALPMLPQANTFEMDFDT